MTQLVNNYAPRYAGTFASFALATSTELTYTVPGGQGKKYIAEFSFQDGTNVWVAYNTAAQEPSAGTMYTSRLSELNPKYRQVNAGDVLHFICATTALGSVSLYPLPG